jgi:Ni/Co efflux regulator RcnB
VLAQGNSRRDDNRNSENCRNDSSRCVGNRDRQYPQTQPARHNDRQDDRRDDRRDDRLPPHYRTYQYVVEDWRGHGLHSPPRGYHWVQTGGDYVLAAIATGIILELLLGN